jgi:sugar lactone lactonase YvrE
MIATRYISRFLVIVVLALGLVGVGTTGMASSGTVVADGLANPRGLVIMDDGTIYVAEAGLGGTEAFTAPPYPPSTRGITGRVTKIAPGGAKTTVTANLPSLSIGGQGNAFVLGPAGMIMANGALWLATGAMLNGYPPAPNASSVLRIDPQSGAVTQVADLAAFERANNPDTFEITNDPYGIVMGGDGNLYVADSGANDLIRVNPQTGQATLVTVFAGIPRPTANPARGGKNENDPVPSNIVVGPDGNLYVGLLTGFPTVKGGAKVLRVTPGGAVSDVVTGLTSVSWLTFGPDGLLYVAEFGVEAPNSGRITRVLADGTKQTVAEGLNDPDGVAFDKAGNLYVAVNGSAAPNDGPLGQIVRIDGVAKAASQPAVTAPSSAPAPQRPGANFIHRLGDG